MSADRIDSEFFVTRHERHTSQDVEILANRHAVYQQARDRHPQRWSKSFFA